ncbi:thioredoxin family protein [Pedobacter nototheniae]|uniref:thioredoxin family protein n=1 Tax=Pedobacter nototheniae TaxID=2488994 RepID=UPI00292F5343|nr:thioredoxin fold domain-containing protein [Pedobacter nototheniae]
MKKLFFLLLMMPLLSLAQQNGTHFEHNLTWAQAKEKAKSEKKYLFVDCFTTWCGPCKYMSANIFPQQKVGDFFNKNFVNIKVQIDKTAQDNEEVKAWYADAAYIAKEYKVRAYPTFLIFSPEGELVHQIVGGGEADYFIAKANKAFNPETQYFTLIRKYNAGEKDPAFLKSLTYAADEAYDSETKDKVATEYIASQTDLYTKENLEFLGKFTASSKSKGFEVILKNPEKVDAVLGKGTASKILSDVIMNEEVYALVKGKSDPKVNVDELESKIKVKYPSVDLSKSLAMFNVQYYQNKKDWPAYQTAALSYMRKYGNEADANTLNSLAWTVFENCHDPACVAEALNWSKRSVESTKSEQPALIDTYANLLHKLGKTEEAIKWEEKAINLVPAAEKPNYQSTLDKMKKGEKTW